MHEPVVVVIRELGFAGTRTGDPLLTMDFEACGRHGLLVAPSGANELVVRMNCEISNARQPAVRALVTFRSHGAVRERSGVSLLDTDAGRCL
jgi:hypothetical protein